MPTPRRNPFALGYLAVLLGTTLFARFGDAALVDRLQEFSSSDGHNLLDHPVRSLLLSGLWVAGPVWMPYFWAFAVTVAPLERRVGARRTILVLAAGHVLATLLSQAAVGFAVSTGRLAPEALDSVDIGVSYGVLASLGALGALLPGSARPLVLTGAVAMTGYQFVSDSELVTRVGHPAALLIGVALGHWLRRGSGRGLSVRRLVPSRV
ncbi:rhomboid-like protein [Kitasatospora sp. NPDC002040]|uniref:rhomboid-like protein n=1 Tax=Kitasatospora sp. NPDC002040 TaxID=3154661 RepID=UPI00332C4CAC